MRNRGLPDSQIQSHPSFFDRWYQHGSVIENDDNSWKVGPNKIIHEVSSEISFSASTPELHKPSNSQIFSFKDQISTPTTDFVLPKVSSSAHAKVIPSISKITPPRSARSSIKYSRQFEEIIRDQQQKADQIPDMMQEVPLLGAHVNDIRKRIRNYQPVSRVRKLPDDVDRSTKIEDSNILTLSRQVLKELKKDKQEEKLAAQLKRLKKHNIDKMFDNIKRESDRKIKETVEKLRIIKKQDILFHEKTTKELQELDYMGKEIIIGFEKLQQKTGLDFKEQQTKKLETLILQNCEKCRILVENTPPEENRSIKRMRKRHFENEHFSANPPEKENFCFQDEEHGISSCTKQGFI